VSASRNGSESWRHLALKTSVFRSSSWDTTTANRPPRLRASLLSNFERWNQVRPSGVEDEFMFVHSGETRPRSAVEPAIVLVAGAGAVLSAPDLASLRNKVEGLSDGSALVGKASQMIRKAADDPRSDHVIGKDLMAVTLYSDPTREELAEYLPERSTSTLFFPDRLYATGDPDTGGLAIRGAQIEVVDPTSEALWVRKVGRNQPCPCGSGKKYKRCHGGATPR
jgi:hypothetical protein